MTIAAFLIALGCALAALRYRRKMLTIAGIAFEQEITIAGMTGAADIFHAVISTHGCPQATEDLASPGTIAECTECGAQWRASELTISWDEDEVDTYAQPDQTWVLAGHREHLPLLDA